MSSSDESNLSDINVNITGYDPQQSDFHIIKMFLKQLLIGLPCFSEVNLADLANEIINQAGKVGSVLVNVDDINDTNSEEPLSKQPKLNSTNVEKEPQEDSILGLCSVIKGDKLPKKLSKLLEIESDKKSVWLINERLEALPMSVSIPLLKTTVIELKTVYKEIDTIHMLARGFTTDTKNLEKSELINDEYSVLLNAFKPTTKGINTKFIQTSGLESARRNLWDDQDENIFNGEKSKTESDQNFEQTLPMIPVRMLASCKLKKFEKFVEYLGNCV